ncbi:MAG: cobalamin-binding protein [Candidatus Brockarchaeota archaeon]|nr:cobalamin-binding protein [Candidatus Brockarchaeota archaeon]
MNLLKRGHGYFIYLLSASVTSITLIKVAEDNMDGLSNQVVKMKLKLSIPPAGLLLILLLGGAMKTSAVSTDELSYPISVVDDFGRNVTVAAMPERIVSLAPSATEILFALNLGSRVIGVTRYCDYPPEVVDRVRSGNLTVVGGFVDISVETVIALDPDLVVATYSLQAEIINLLEEKGLTVIGLNPKDLQQILNDVRLVGLLCGETGKAEQLVADLQRRIEYVAQRVKEAGSRPRVYYEVWYDPLMSVGPETVQNDLIHTAGGENIFADAQAPYPTISSEAVITRDPEVIIVPTGYMGGVKSEDFEKRPGWSGIDAVKNSRIFEVDENLIVRPGPRVIEGLERIALILHPDRFTGRIEVMEEIVLETNSTITYAYYDETRMLLNLTAKGEDGTVGALNATISKTLLDGAPVVFMDGREIPSSYTENSTHYQIHITYNHTSHTFTIGGVNTIPEFPRVTSLLVIILTLMLIHTSRRMEGRA